MSSPLLKLQEASRAFSATEYAVARQILDNPAMVEDLSVHELAKQTFASPSTVVRMCVHAGYSGYKEFRKAVVSELLLRQQNRTVEHRELERSDSLEEIVDGARFEDEVFLLSEDAPELNKLLTDLAAEAVNSEASFISVYYGEDVSEEDAQAVGAIFQNACPDAEISVLSGGQPVYYYLISFE